MAFNHYLPASYLARFSLENNSVRRENRVWVADKVTRKYFCKKVAGVCGENGYYDVHDRPNIKYVDESWGYYEDKLGSALDQMVSGDLDALTWATVLVDFVASLFVRGNDFVTRFNARLEHLLPGITQKLLPDNAQYARIFELNNLRFSVLSSRWLLRSTSGKEPLITNDRGYVPFAIPERKESGIAIPIDKTHVLLIIPGGNHVIAVGKAGVWRPTIARDELPDDQFDTFLESVAVHSSRFLVGADDVSVRKNIHSFDAAPSIEPIELGFFSGRQALYHEERILDLIRHIETPPVYDGDHIFVRYEEGPTPPPGLLRRPIRRLLFDRSGIFGA
jgi:hypothetical protein